MALPFLFLLPSQLPFQMFYHENKFKRVKYRKDEVTMPPTRGVSA
jgi:hypothetical protein